MIGFIIDVLITLVFAYCTVSAKGSLLLTFILAGGCGFWLRMSITSYIHWRYNAR